MGEPFSNLTGNGLHTHMSLWSTDDKPLLEGDDNRMGRVSARWGDSSWPASSTTVSRGRR